MSARFLIINVSGKIKYELPSISAFLCFLISQWFRCPLLAIELHLVKHTIAIVFAGYQVSVGLKYGITEEDMVSASKNCLKTKQKTTTPQPQTNEKKTMQTPRP